jgi:DNA invertase Pin-like site-specific DNA recombinase
MKAKRFVSWAAVSSLPQAKKISLSDQLATNREHAERWGGVVVDELVVPGESRNIVLFEDAARKMPAYARLRELIDARAFDVLIYLDRSRLGRKAALSMAVVALCAEAGIAAYEVENPPATLDANQSHDDMLIGAIKSVGAEREVRKLQERHRAGMIGRIKAGKPANKLVYGYRWHYAADGSKAVVIDEAAAAVVSELFTLYLMGHGTPYIAAHFNAAGHPTPEGRGDWRAINVRSILDNVRRYAGITAVNRRSRKGRPYTEAAGAWPALISADMLALIEAERRYREANRRRVDTPYLLSGVVCCRHCGRRMIVRRVSGRKPHHKDRMLLVCLEHGGISYRRVEAKLRVRMESLREADLDGMAADAVEPAAALHARQAQVGKLLTDLDAALARADSAYVRGTMTADRYEAQVERIGADAAAAHEELAQIAAALTQESESGGRRQRLEDAAALGLAKMDDPDGTAANAWLRAHVRVWVDGREVFAVEWL